MPTLSELLAQQAAITKQIEEIRQAERKDAITQILKLVADRKPSLLNHINELECISKTKISENLRFCCTVPANKPYCRNFCVTFLYLL